MGHVGVYRAFALPPFAGVEQRVMVLPTSFSYGTEYCPPILKFPYPPCPSPRTLYPQIRVGAANENRGKAFVIYEDIYDAKDALEHLNGFNVCGRYLVVLYFHPEKEQKRVNLEKQRKEVEELRKMVDAGRGK